MYSIGNIIYGTPLTEEVNELAKEVEAVGEKHPLFEHLYDEEQFAGFETYYHGSLPWQPGYCGVELGRMDVCSDFRVSDIANLKPTDEQKAAAKEAYDALPSEVRERCMPLDTYVVWSTS